MNSRVERQTVDLSAYPDLVVIYLGMRVNALTGVKTLLGLGPQIKNSVDQKPDGLLLHENFLMSVMPLHLGMRQYWRDFDALEAWSRSPPHRDWWRDFLRSSRGTGFWHEAYFMRGGMEAVYDDVAVRLGFGQFAPLAPARGPMFSARSRRSLRVRHVPRSSKRPSFMAWRARGRGIVLEHRASAGPHPNPLPQAGEGVAAVRRMREILLSR
jgi:hypothetical protein